MKQPEGFEVGRPEYVCKLDKLLYGPKQASRVWNKTLHVTHGFGTSLIACYQIVALLYGYGIDWIVGTHSENHWVGLYIYTSDLSVCMYDTSQRWWH
jgi:hypothetical protein